jgi:hypothetical protein
MFKTKIELLISWLYSHPRKMNANTKNYPFYFPSCLARRKGCSILFQQQGRYLREWDQPTLDVGSISQGLQAHTMKEKQRFNNQAFLIVQELKAEGQGGFPGCINLLVVAGEW